ncbi:transcription termination factor Rho [Mycobacterium sp. 663a-19]|uniref:transcription termination factor Rho n=1 Tax=Mycobacterium sp. 663a-19 TaxID=2986148 RepID=UPI002D1F2369|nr:transcription termination factor Rho [Mycobacterium sp. 663a-19]MEB3981126.1 transcription termination factor Rho [Mycobacterium sp. 663a-19]
MTDTDLFTASESTDGDRPSDPVNTDKPDAKSPDAKSDVSVGSLSTMVLPELRALANRAGVKGTSGMRKNELIAAIQEIRGQANGASAPSAPPDADDKSDTATAEAPAAQGEQGDSADEAPRRERRDASRDAGSVTRTAEEADRKDAKDAKDGKEDAKEGAKEGPREGKASGESRQGGQQDTKTEERGQGGGDRQGSGGQQGRGGSNQQDDDGEGRQGRRGRRFRDRDRRRRGERGGDGADAELREDDVVQPVAGILDVLDNYAFVRTSGYLAGPHDVYVSMNMVRKNGLRRGDAVTGAVRVPREGEQPNQRQKFNPLVRLDTVNGGSVEDAKKRPEFSKLTPLYPNQRLRLETTPDRLTTRVIDLIMPIGKGQRALIVSPPKAGKTTILQDIANAITKNNPECHLMVVLVDERPEEVTDMQRSVKGEVIASTFDRPPSDHTQAAELAIERAKRLVEQGKDVVVLLDSITRLGRAYNNASPASGRILSGGVDSTALYPPKRFLGAARNIEEGGSLTIIATAMVETGSTGDTVIFEEFKGTGNAELKLDRKISERRVFPAVDVNPSGTRKDELLLSPDEFGIVHKLRRVLSGLDSHQAIDLLMSQLRKTKTNYEFLVQVSKTTPGSMDND